MSVIFLAGVHGVGKGFLGATAAQVLGISHFTASQLIREEKGGATWGTDKRTSDIDDNQRALISAVNQRRATHNILLDGHFVLRSGQAVLIPLEMTVFKELQLTGVILLTEESKVIASRLAMRDKGETDVDAISELAKAESAHAHKVCCELRLPLVVIYSPTDENLTNAIKGLLRA